MWWRLGNRPDQRQGSHRGRQGRTAAACRRFRALDLWFVLRMYGTAKLQALVRHHIALGEWLAQQVQADSRCAGAVVAATVMYYGFFRTTAPCAMFRVRVV